MSPNLFVKTLLVVSAIFFADVGYAASMKTICTVSASMHGGKKFAVLKCSKSITPEGADVRYTVWEKDDKKAYNRLARFSGRRFTCDMSRGSTMRDTNIETTNYNISNCK